MSKWSVFSLDSLCKRITDGAHNSPVSVEHGYPMASVKDMTPYGLKLNTCRHISETDYLSLVKQGCQPEIHDVLIAKDGATAIDTVCIVRKKEDVVLLSSVAILRPNEELVYPFYLKYYLSCSTVKSYIKGSFTTGAAIPRVVLQDFKKLKVNLPDLTLQHKIVAILDSYDRLIENNNRRIAILEEMAQKLYREWFVHFRFPGHENVKMVESEMGMIPEGWHIFPFDDVAKFIKGKKPCVITNKAQHGNVKYILLNAVANDAYEFVNPKNMVLVETEDIIMVMDGASSGKVFSGECGAIGSTLAKVYTTEEYRIVLFMCLATYETSIMDNNTGSAIPHANKDFINMMLLTIPSDDLLTQFNSIIREYLNEKRTLKEKNTNLRKTRDLLLPRLIYGDIDVSKLNISIREEQLHA